MWWLVLPILLVAILAIAIGVRTANRARAVDAKPTTDNPPHANCGNRRARAHGGRTALRQHQRGPCRRLSGAGPAGDDPQPLSRISGLSVIARNSSFALATKSIDSSEIGRRLNSGYLINGSVQRKADRLRVAVQLVDAAAGTQVWSAHFDRALSDIFSVEDEIADQVADALSARLGGLEPTPVHDERSSNIEAYLAFLRGRALLGRFTVTESEAAVPYFEKALALDPNFAAAYASLYDARMQAVDQRMEDLTLARRRYHHLIDRALELDPKLGAAYFARAMWGDVPHDADATADNTLVVALERDFQPGRRT